jgi:hypothetical protein
MLARNLAVQGNAENTSERTCTSFRDDKNVFAGDEK